MISHQAIGEYFNGKDLGKLAELVYRCGAPVCPETGVSANGICA
jgi:hypothetical protein